MSPHRLNILLKLGVGFIFVLAFTLSGFAHARPMLRDIIAKRFPQSTTTPQNPAAIEADFALYDPDYEDDGVWEEEVTALVTFFNRYGYSYRRVDANTLNSGGLMSATGRRFKALIAPGGYAPYRNQAVTAAGNTQIRDFIKAGGNYVGFCAGAYWAAKIVRWSETGIGYRDYPYPLGLFPGIEQGPLGWMPWRSGTNINLDVAQINTGIAALRNQGLPTQTRFVYGGGPWFVEPSTPLPGYEVWARAVAPASAPSRDGDHKPTIIRFKYGQGDVILFSYHPDILIASNEDHVILRQYYNEAAIRWNWGDQSPEEVNRYSMAIVQAALAVAAGQTP